MPDETQPAINSAPPTLDHIIGQKRAVRQLRTALEAHITDRSEARGEVPALAHCLLVGPAGVGKSLLSSIIARELGTNLHEELAQNIVSPGHLHGLMMLIEAGDVVFVDEIHELHPVAQTTLYRAMEERRLFIQTGFDQERKPMVLPPFTFIAATTDEWGLTKPLRDRFKIIIRLDYYTANELAELVAQRARRLRWSISEEAINGIAARSKGTPRLALRLLDAARRTARAEGSSHISTDDFNRMCEIEQLHGLLGLDMVEQKYLKLLKDGHGEPIRLNVVATCLGLPRRTVERVIESELVRLQLITKSDSGRMLTARGLEHLNTTNG